MGLPDIDSTATITVETVGVDSDAQGVQVNVQHSHELQVSSPACAGIFAGATQLGPSPVAGGTVVGCLILGGTVTGPTGPAMTFGLTRVQDFDADLVITFGVGGPLGTSYSEGGTTMGPGLTNQLTVRPSSQ